MWAQRNQRQNAASSRSLMSCLFVTLQQWWWPQRLFRRDANHATIRSFTFYMYKDSATSCMLILVSVTLKAQWYVLPAWTEWFYNRNGACLLCGTNRIFKCSSICSHVRETLGNSLSLSLSLSVLFVGLLARSQYASGRSCDRPSRHRFSLVFLCFQANAEMVPKIPSCYCMLLMQPSRFKLSKLILSLRGKKVKITKSVTVRLLTRNQNLAAPHLRRTVRILGLPFLCVSSYLLLDSY